MIDQNQFIADLASIHRVLRHEGVIGVGRDILTGLPCSLHSYTDRFGRSYIMQMFDKGDEDTINSKISYITKTVNAFLMPNLLRMSFIGTNKHSKRHELGIFYDTTKLGETTLENEMLSRITNDERFKAEYLMGFFWQIADLLQSAYSSNHFIEITPMNIIYKAHSHLGYNYLVTNLIGEVSFLKEENSFENNPKHNSFKKCRYYHNPSDNFWRGAQEHGSMMRASIFMLGMVLLEMASLLPSYELYESGHINYKALNKRLEGIKITCDQFIVLILAKMLVMDESRRITVTEIYGSQELLKIRRMIYQSNQTNFYDYSTFEGLINEDYDTAVGKTMDTYQRMQRGVFIKGVLNGLGSKQTEYGIQAGTFVNGELVEGYTLWQNSCIDIGKYQLGSITEGVRIYLKIATTNCDAKTPTAFVGYFRQGKPSKGILVVFDGTQMII